MMLSMDNCLPHGNGAAAILALLPSTYMYLRRDEINSLPRGTVANSLQVMRQRSTENYPLTERIQNASGAVSITGTSSRVRYAEY